MNTMRKFAVLCIEDNDANMLVIERIIESQAFELFKAASAESGIELARQHHPDLILMDMNLPGIDGLEATQRIKKDHTLAHIPIIAVTASSVYTRELCLSKGCSDYILKPVTLTKLLIVLKKYGIGVH
jgi:two-component system cell cycle response regulator DivK